MIGYLFFYPIWLQFFGLLALPPIHSIRSFRPLNLFAAHCRPQRRRAKGVDAGVGSGQELLHLQQTATCSEPIPSCKHRGSKGTGMSHFFCLFPLTQTKKKFRIFFQKIKSTSMPDHHVKGQPAASTHVREKGVSKVTLIMGHPVERI